MKGNLNLVLKNLIHAITEQSKCHLDYIVQESARVENYFTVLMLGELKSMVLNNIISNLEFQKHLQGKKRKHIDFFFEMDGTDVYMEVKHFAIDTQKKKSRRTINFYTSNTYSGKKVGLLGDLEKLSQLKYKRPAEIIVFAIITNPPSEDDMNNKIKEIKYKDDLKNMDYSDWSIFFENKIIQPNCNLGFLIATKK